jgi:hypothetical protein
MAVIPLLFVGPIIGDDALKDKNKAASGAVRGHRTKHDKADVHKKKRAEALLK